MTEPDILAALEADESSRRGPNCSVSSLLATLEAPAADQLRTALAAKLPDGSFRYTATSIQRVLKGRGVIIDDKTINRHRRGQCRCVA